MALVRSCFAHFHLGRNHLCRFRLAAILILCVIPSGKGYCFEESLRFEQISQEQGLSQSFVYCIHQDTKGFMWFGTENGLNRYDGYRVTVFNYDSEDPSSLSDSLINAIYEDRHGVLWIGTDNGLNRFNPEHNSFTRYLHEARNKRSLSHNRILSIFEDRTGVLWVGTVAGLNQFDRQRDVFVPYLEPTDDPDFPGQNTIWRFFEDRQGSLWIGTDDGLRRLNREVAAQATGTSPAGKRRWEAYRHEPDNPNSLSHNLVNSIHEDENGYLWLGTWGGGLHRFDPNKEDFVRFRFKPGAGGISSDTVWSLSDDGSGKIWIGTNNGLTRSVPSHTCSRNRR